MLYWMIAARRSGWNFALQQAADLAAELNVGLVVFEPLACDYPYASDRLHRFVIEGMADNADRLGASCVHYYPWVEPTPGQGRALLQALAQDAYVVVTDDFPTTFHKRLVDSAAGKLDVSLQAVDGNGLLPLQLIERDFTSAHSFRRFLHKALPAFIDERPEADPLSHRHLPRPELDPKIPSTWPAADPKALLRGRGLNDLPIDHRIEAVAQSGGCAAARHRLKQFLERDLVHYPSQRNIPDADRTSRLSAYLHFGHLSVHEIFTALTERENWNSGRLSLKPSGRRHGWWGLSLAAEEYLDELVTWRELGFSLCARRQDYAEYDSLPAWARQTLDLHRADSRLYLYNDQQFLRAETHDPLWNAAQRQLLREGRIHGYLRMLWGKKILEWSETPQRAMEVMIALNDRYALDGRDPSSYNGIGWCLGRFDRAWGPERPVFGKIRYMTSRNTARKVAVRDYLERYAPV